ncbi:uncharacterized protein MKZ38_002857 [Zalerion maritima]|uniref:Uncharacterized protein n=1 Tax=Zalerion maritima TaxID=339359 RepID=A0AAD5RY34_9PEZI|nr:uncharacterized protein MKZ38_002857 [Zalerion maritima]
MKSVKSVAVVGAISAVLTTSVDTHCPTVTATATVCGTCPVKECAAISTVSNPCDCSSPVPTVTTSYPCSASSCPGGCATTLYVSASSSSTCPSDTKSEPCPTVTSTIGTCSTCAVKDCAEYSTIKRPCTCPTYIPTQWEGYPCSSVVVSSSKTITNPGPCPTGCALTSYIYEEDDCPSSVDTRVTCTPTVTISQWAPGPSSTSTTSSTTSGTTITTSTSTGSSTSGCSISCTTGCIMDKFVTLPCGCDVAASVVTETVDLGCATTSNCWNCNTGFPWTTTATDCPNTII